jgi:hypothetical protein
MGWRDGLCTVVSVDTSHENVGYGAPLERIVGLARIRCSHASGSRVLHPGHVRGPVRPTRRVRRRRLASGVLRRRAGRGANGTPRDTNWCRAARWSAFSTRARSRVGLRSLAGLWEARDVCKGRVEGARRRSTYPFGGIEGDPAGGLGGPIWSAIRRVGIFGP